MKTLKLLCLLLVLFLPSFAQQVAKTIPNSTAPEGLIGFLQFTPSDYGSQKHPLIIFMHGTGERGNGTSQINSVAANGIPRLCAAGASMRFTVNGQTSSFVVLSPQLSNYYGSWQTFYVKEMIKYAKANLQIDTNRIYITGLSLGGGGTWNTITEAPNGDYSFDATIAAAAPVCGTQEETDANMCSTVVANHLPIWNFHSMDDGTVGVGASQHAEILLSWCSNVSPAPKFTYYQSGGHSGAWDNAYDTGHITTPVVVNGNVTSFTANPNLYEWFLSQTRSTGYTAPVASAGSAQTITLPTSTVTLSGSGTGTNGATISSYSWVKTSGPSSGSITTSNAASTGVTGLVQGTYVFTLTVTDNHGLTTSASVTITVNPAYTAPVASAGSAQTITLPTSTVTLSGSGTGTNGATISSYSWVKTSGPSSGSITTSNAASTGVTGLVQGTYVFTLTVTDNHGLTNSASVTITVNAAYTAPTASAGNAQSITLPTSSVTLSGSGAGTNGATISSYSWVKTSGPSSGSITTANAASTGVTGLVQGSYVFTLTVTDNHGLTATSSVTITVIAAPVADAGPSQTITTSSTALSASASYSANGAITSYQWQQVSGPSAAVISNATSVTPVVSDLTLGSTYSFELTVTDVAGASSTAVTGVTIVSSLLPVQFSYFNGVASSGSNLLQWGTASEQNNSYFSIERSVDGNSFTSIGTVTAVGNSSTAHDYNYTDATISASTYYYRLKQVDINGTFSYSKVIVLKSNTTNASVQLFPNPVVSALSIMLNNDVKGNGFITIYDINGRNLRQQAIAKTGQTTSAVVNMNDLAAGMYVVEIKIGDAYKLSKTVLKK